ncbi:MAG: GAF domain-containing protein [Anaerolineae bacterium]|nr:GAF domain-containing protein [Anaerolineae bacterium]
MFVLRDVLQLLTSPPGGMVYHLVLLLSIWAVVGLSLSRWSRGERSGSVPRLLLASSLLSVGRLVLFLIALFDRAGSDPGLGYLITIGVPLERFLDALAVLLICWSIALSPAQRTLGRIYIGVTLVLALCLYIICAIEWASTLQLNPEAIYNQSWQRWAWELSQVVVLLGVWVYVIAVPIQERGLVLVLLSVLAVGHVMQAIAPQTDHIPDLAGWVRLAHVIAFPYFAVTAYQLTLSRFDAHAASLQSTNKETLDQIAGTMDLLDAGLSLSASLDQDTVLQRAVHSASKLLDADLCAIAVLDSGAADAELKVAHRAAEVERPGRRFQVSRYAAVQRALGQGRPVVSGPQAEPGISEVHELLDNRREGPLVIQPLAHNAETVGILFASRPHSLAPFTASQVQRGEVLAQFVAIALLNARAYADTGTRIAEHKRSIAALEQGLSRTRADLENRLRQAKEEIAVYVQKLYEAEVAEQRAQTDARELRQQLRALSQEGGAVRVAPVPPVEGAAEGDLLRKRLATLEVARQQLQRQVEDLEQERKELRAQVAQLESAAAEPEGALPTPELALEALPYGVIVADAGGAIVRLNTVAARRLNLRPDTWVGRTLDALWPEEEWQSAVRALMHRDPTQTSPLEPISVRRPADDVEISLVPLRADQQQVGVLLLVLDTPRDVEDRRARDEFLSSVSQELRTPMTSILGYTELLMNESVGSLETMQRKFLQRVQANVERMGAMLNDLIGVTAIDSGTLQIELEPVDVELALGQALHKVQFRLEERDLQTHVAVSSLDPIYVDPESFQQVIDNLLNNACKSSTAGTTIHVRAAQESDESGRALLHVAVTDTGGGIAPEDHTRVFERFYRADDALIAGLGETGVGLAIVKALVEMHQGRVWIESEMGRGTTFHFTLPYGLQHSMDIDPSNRALAQRRARGARGHE